MAVRIPSRRSFIVGPAFAVGEDVIDEGEHFYVAHVGDPPFVARVAEVEDEDGAERLIDCGDGQALVDLVWLTPKRANGRLLDSLLAAAADAVAAFNADDFDDVDEDGDDAVSPEDARGLAEQVLKGAARAGLDVVPILGFASEADYRRVMGDDVDAVMTWSFYLDYVAALDSLAPDAGIEVLRLACDPDRYDAWLKEVERPNTPEARLDYLDELAAAADDDR